MITTPTITTDDPAGADPLYAIRVVTAPPGDMTRLQRLVWPKGREGHSFLQLSRMAEGGARDVLAELHFTCRDADGTATNVGKKPMNMAGCVAAYLGLEGVFQAAAEALGYGEKIARIKGVQTGYRYDDATLRDHGSVTGPRAQILETWNRACTAAVAINEQNMPFLSLGPDRTGPINCHAGTKAVLRALGGAYERVASGLSLRGRDLTSRIADTIARLRDPATLAAITPESLDAAQEAMTRKLYETSRRPGTVQRATHHAQI